MGVASYWEWIRGNVIGDALPTFMVCTQTTVLCWRWTTRLELVSMQLLVEGKDYQVLTYCHHHTETCHMCSPSHHHSNIECVDLMIGVCCDVNARDKLGRTPLHYAASTAQYQCVLSLVANSASLTAVDKLDRTPLHYAAAADGDAKSVRQVNNNNNNHLVF